MKISVFGCGALGSYYGARLAAAGHDVHFLLRSDYETVRQAGVTIRSVAGDFRVHPHAAATPSEIGPCELVLIGLKTTANHVFGQVLPALLGPETAIVTLQNGLGNEEQLARLFGGERVLGGLCFVCLNRIAPGVIQHLAHGDVMLGEFQRPALARTHFYAQALREARVACQVTDDLERAHWQKLVWNIPFNGLGVAGAAGYESVVSGQLAAQASLGSVMTTDRLLQDPRWAGLVRELMSEVIAAANQLGLGLSESLVDDRIAATRQMGAYKASTLIDFERGQGLELDSLFLEPLRRAEAAGVHTPRLASLVRVLTALDPGAERGKSR